MKPRLAFVGLLAVLVAGVVKIVRQARWIGTLEKCNSRLQDLMWSRHEAANAAQAKLHVAREELDEAREQIAAMEKAVSEKAVVPRQEFQPVHPDLTNKERVFFGWSVWETDAWGIIGQVNEKLLAPFGVRLNLDDCHAMRGAFLTAEATPGHLGSQPTPEKLRELFQHAEGKPLPEAIADAQWPVLLEGGSWLWIGRKWWSETRPEALMKWLNETLLAPLGVRIALDGESHPAMMKITAERVFPSDVEVVRDDAGKPVCAMWNHEEEHLTSFPRKEWDRAGAAQFVEEIRIGLLREFGIKLSWGHRGRDGVVEVLGQRVRDERKAEAVKPLFEGTREQPRSGLQKVQTGAEIDRRSDFFENGLKKALAPHGVECRMIGEGSESGDWMFEFVSETGKSTGSFRPALESLQKVAAALRIHGVRVETKIISRRGTREKAFIFTSGDQS